MSREPGTVYLPVGRQFRALTVFCVAALLMVGGLYVVAREKPSVRSVNPQALQTVVVTADKGCQNFADFWLGQSGLGLDPSIIHGLTNCWQDAGGTWIASHASYGAAGCSFRSLRMSSSAIAT